LKVEHEESCYPCICNLCVNDHTNDDIHEKACCEEHFPMRRIPWECDGAGKLKSCPDFAPETEETIETNWYTEMPEEERQKLDSESNYGCW